MEPNIAVLIDFENIAAGSEKEGLGKVNVSLIMNRLREKGRVLIARSYADWGRFARFKKDLLFEGIQLFELSAHGMNDKNRADVALVVDCMELALTKDFVDTYVIVSGDSDFTPLICKLRELNKRVIGCGTRRSTSKLIVESCDEFFFYDSLRQQKTQRPRKRSDDSDKAPVQVSREDAMEMVTEALSALNRDDPRSHHASRIKEQIKRKAPSFSEQDLGFSSFARFLEYCKKQDLVRLERDAKGGGYLVDLPTDSNESTAPEPEVKLSGEARKLYDLLAGEDLEMLSRGDRQAMCEALVDNVEDRKSRNKRVNLQWVTQDVIKRLKGAQGARRIKAQINQLHLAGAFLHTDGEPIRSYFAAFELRDDAAGLARKLEVQALRKLMELGVDLAGSVPALAELLLGDKEQVRVVEELVAWELMSPQPEVVAPLSKDDDKPRRRRTRKGKDDEADAAPEAAAADAAAEKKTRRRKPRKANGDAEAAEAASTEAPAEAPATETAEAATTQDAAAEAKPAPKKKATRKRAPRKAKAPAATEDAPAAEAAAEPVAEEAPKKPRRRKVTKKAEPPAVPDPTPAAEAAPAEEEAPKPTTRRRRATRKKPAAETPVEAAPEAPASESSGDAASPEAAQPATT